MKQIKFLFIIFIDTICCSDLPMEKTMNKPQYDKSIDMLEDIIMHFLVIGNFEITGVLCELLLECDDIYSACQRQTD